MAAGETAAEPAGALPVAKFVPVQELALVEDQVSVEDCPLRIDDGVALRLAVGAPADTVTVALDDALLTAPVQVTLYVVVDVGEMEADPDVMLLVEKLVPVQEVAFVED